MTIRVGTAAPQHEAAKEGISPQPSSILSSHQVTPITVDHSSTGRGQARPTMTSKIQSNLGTTSQTPLSFRAKGRWRHESEWISESYSVRDCFYLKITREMGVTPEVDVFSDTGAHRETPKAQEWWGPGSPFGQDAFAQDWGGRELWMNPPFSRFPEVINKIKEDGAHGILVMPEWPRRRWFKEARKMQRGSLLYPKYTKLFELDGKPAKGTLWATRVMAFCGHTPKCPPPSSRVQGRS